MKDKHRSIVWGSARSETISEDDGRVTLQTAEPSELDALAERVRKFMIGYVQRFDLDDAQLRGALLADAWLLGYAFGACAACVGSASDTGLTGFASRVCGEILGGGTQNKLAAYTRINEILEDEDFTTGCIAARRDWVERWR